jgi:hypothetical protein
MSDALLRLLREAAAPISNEFASGGAGRSAAAASGGATRFSGGEPGAPGQGAEPSGAAEPSASAEALDHFPPWDRDRPECDEPITDNIPGLGTFILRRDRNARKRRRDFINLGRSQRAKVVKMAYRVVESVCDTFCPGEKLELLDALVNVQKTYRRHYLKARANQRQAQAMAQRPGLNVGVAMGHAAGDPRWGSAYSGVSGGLGLGPAPGSSHSRQTSGSGSRSTDDLLPDSPLAHGGGGGGGRARLGNGNGNGWDDRDGGAEGAHGWGEDRRRFAYGAEPPLPRSRSSVMLPPPGDLPRSRSDVVLPRPRDLPPSRSDMMLPPPEDLRRVVSEEAWRHATATSWGQGRGGLAWTPPVDVDWRGGPGPGAFALPPPLPQPLPPREREWEREHERERGHREAAFASAFASASASAFAPPALSPPPPPLPQEQRDDGPAIPEEALILARMWRDTGPANKRGEWH